MKVIYHKKFNKKYAKLSPIVKQKFKERRNLFLNDPVNPLLRNHSVERAYPGCKSINITGDYRAIFRETAISVEFINIGTHSQLYG
jgi:mRNA-degrading endonuclease YafQ of YafQ-DinJ toxin-antitoxin module